MTEFLVPVYIAAVFIGVFALFGYVMDARLLPAVKAGVCNTLGGCTQERGAVSLFLDVFDRLFDAGSTGRPHLGRALSALAVVLLLMLAGWAILLPERAALVFGHPPGERIIVQLLGILVLTNFIGSVFSLWQTRLFAGWMTTAGRPTQAVLLLLDIVAALLVYCAGLLFGMLVLLVLHVELWEIVLEFGMNEELANFYSSLFEMLVTDKGLLFCPPDTDFLDLRFISDLVSMGFYAALLPSLWLCVFLLGMKARPPFKWLGGILHTDRFPVGATLTLGAALIALAAMAAFYGLRLYHVCV